MQEIETTPEQERQRYLEENVVSVIPFATKWRVTCRDRSYQKFSTRRDAIKGAKKLAEKLGSCWRLLNRKGETVYEGESEQ